ncbi:MAG: Calx-beta domain-containing protein, partial [Planctomycetota bacterium]
VQTTQDELLEPNETFLVNLTNATGGLTIGTAQATGTIRDDESTVFYYVDPPIPTEEGTGIQFVIRRTGTVQNIDFSNANLPDVGQSITYWTSIRSSDNSEVGDFTGIPIGTPASITFGANDRSVTVTVNTINDSIYEGDETFGFFLGNPSTLLAGNSTATETNPDGNEVTATIVDNDAAPKFSVVVGSPSSVVEGNPITFIITRDADSEQPQSIDYSTVIRASDSTAINDFTATSGTFTFNPGEFGSGNSKTVTVTTIEDSIAEGPETFGFAISNPTGGAQLDPTKTVATGTLLDSNTAPTASNTTVGTVTKPALEDIPYVFGEFDFGYTDAENAPLWSIQVKTLPAIGGTLTGVLQKATTSTPDGLGGTTLGGWTPVAVDDVLTISGPLGIGAGALRYLPPSNANNQTLSAAPTFSVRVNDGVNFSSDSPTTNRGTVTINITPVNDAPAGADVSPAQSAYVGGFITFTESQFIMSDSNDDPQNNFLGVVFTDVPERPNPTATPAVPNRGALQVQVGEDSTSRTGNILGARDIRTSAFSQSTSAGTPQFVTAESGSWTFSSVTYDKRLMGRYGTAYLDSTTGNYYFDQFTDGAGGFTFIAQYTGSSAPYTPVYEPLNIPTGTMVSDGFLFDVGENGTDFFRRTLTFTLTGTGSGFNFQSNVWKTVVDGEFVPKATITAEKLRYSPCFCGVARYNRDGSFQLTATAGTFTTIKFQVQDDGGTANGGVDLDPT